ncbi:hypothetical protein LNV23_08340 [Paucibacter sp. DJ1R-11]|uniref:hypothetical protein n=1 Tax=Paucibacter sp. DJ1R-11 TaxID=2893556 RepID=UPI0021E51624|nr:hypothetical protein [Paucibacter sp. DJ1R-11]MCV2363453.1 hypothetical protein [Paucibacter sp. DJ1R-11]
MKNLDNCNIQRATNAIRKWQSLVRNSLTLVVVVGALAACANSNDRRAAELRLQQQRRAIAMWQERCKKSGEFIHKTVEGVEGVYLVNVRMRTNRGESERDQFELDDPYGHDSIKDNYILNFLHGFYYRTPETTPKIAGGPPRIGYSYVEAIDPNDGQLTRYTGRVDEPWQQDKSYLKGYTRFMLDRAPIEKRTARYGVRFEDISTRVDREHWIAGSSLKVIDLKTQEVIAERVGYMVDWAQGSRAGSRQPWTFAADNACPDFYRHYPRRGGNASGEQPGQTLDFVEQVLRPTRRKP